MIELLCIRIRDHGLIKIKITNEVSAILAFRGQQKAEDYVRDSVKADLQADCEICELSFEMFDEARRWADQSGIDLVVHICDQ